MATPRPRSVLDYTRMVLGAATLGHGAATLEDVVEVMREFHQNSVLAVLARLNLALTHPRALNQQAIVRAWLGAAHGERLLRVAGAYRVNDIFYEAQVLNLIRLALLYSPQDGGRRCDTIEDFRRLTVALVMLTDVIHPHGADARSTVFANFTRSELFQYDEPLRVAMARTYDLFVMLPRILSVRGRCQDLGALFARVTGIEAVDYLGLGFGLLSYYLPIAPDRLLDGAISVMRATYFKDTKLRDDVHERVWPLLSRPLDKYQDSLKAEWATTSGPARFSTAKTFSQHPMIELPDGAVVCLSYRLLRHRFTNGAYWVVANALTDKQRDAFTTSFGEVFEEYVRRCFLRALGRSFYPRATYGRNQRPLVDGALKTPRSMGLLECKAGRMLLEVRESGDETALETSVRKVFGAASAQLADAVEAGQRGEIEDIGMAAETRYYPMIVTYEHLPSHPLALDLYKRVLAEEPRLQGPMVKPVTLLGVRDVESLEAAIADAGEAWPDFLTRKHTDRYRDVSFHNYVLDRYGKDPPSNRYLLARWEDVGDTIGMRTFGQPLRGHGE